MRGWREWAYVLSYTAALVAAVGVGLMAAAATVRGVRALTTRLTAHASWDLALIAAAVVELALLFWLLGQRRYWKRFARIIENRMLDARERAGEARRDVGLLRRAVALVEKLDGDRRNPPAAHALLKRWMNLSLADRGDRDQLERDTDEYLNQRAWNEGAPAPANDA